MSDPIPRKDPLESVWVCSLFFGGILVLVSLFGIARQLLLGSEVRGADVGHAWVFLALVGGLMGPAVALVRRATRKRAWRTKNAATGVVTGAVYSLACAMVAGQGMSTTEKVGLGVVVFGGFAWAVASGLNQSLPERAPPTKRRRPPT